tara:strand:+ start:4516 stop:5472 length:957 start_codon:yes stop_codon:yes gene_type:complete
MSSAYTHGSFCTGYGGLDIAVEEFFDAETVWYSEIDTKCNTILEQHNYKNNLGDLTKIDWNQVEQVDIMSAGFPCQPFSVASHNRKGMNDERAIFPWIAHGISVLRPRIVILENVGGLLNLGGTSVIGMLTEIGYDCRWSVISASEAGAPHQRRRWFCIAEAKNFIAYTSSTRSQRHWISSITTTEKITNTPSDSETFANSIRVNKQKLEKRLQKREESKKPSGCFDSRRGNQNIDWGKYEQAIRRWEHVTERSAPIPVDEKGLTSYFVEWMMGLPENHVCNRGLSRAHELKMLGNGVVPRQAFLALELLYNWRRDCG